MVKPLVGKQLLIDKTTFCGLLKWISKIQLTFHCSEIGVWKIERFLNWWWSTFGCMFNCSAELFMSGKKGLKHEDCLIIILHKPTCNQLIYL